MWKEWDPPFMCLSLSLSFSLSLSLLPSFFHPPFSHRLQLCGSTFEQQQQVATLPPINPSTLPPLTHSHTPILSPTLLSPSTALREHL